MKAPIVALWTLVAAQAPAPPIGTLVVQVTKVHSDKGSVVCGLHASGDGFPKHGQITRQTVPIVAGAAVCTFVGLPSGTYAVAVFHDENGNGKLDTNFLGIPAEGVGVSNNVRPFMGPPSWSASKFTLAGDKTLTVSLRY